MNFAFGEELDLFLQEEGLVVIIIENDGFLVMKGGDEEGDEGSDPAL